MIQIGENPMSEYRETLKEEFRDKEYREAYADDFLNTKIATQIRAIRERRGLTQKELGEKIGTKQEGVSRLENVNHASWNIATLKKIAFALDGRLNVSIETYGSLLDEAETFSRESLERPSFEQDPEFKEKEIAVGAGAGQQVSNLADKSNETQVTQGLSSSNNVLDFYSSRKNQQSGNNLLSGNPTSKAQEEAGGFLQRKRG
jgi:transcriptional regulator with XRE-family HTH domain